MNGIYTDKFARDLLDLVNEECYLWLKTYFIYDGGIDYGDDDEDDINDFIIDTFEVTIYTDVYKILHKRNFYKDLYDDLMSIAWHPDRYIDWCLDFEELRDLKERWGLISNSKEYFL